MTRLCVLVLGIAALTAATGLACGDDSQSNANPTATTVATSTEAATPLDELECGAPLPDVTLEFSGTTQTAVPLNAEWVGLDCTIGGQTYDFYYIPTEPLEVSAEDEPTLVLSQPPEKLTLSTWLPDLTGSTVIAGGETALPMDVTNSARLISARQLPVQVAANQQIEIAGLAPGDYVIEVLSFWPDGVATLALRMAVTD